MSRSGWRAGLRRDPRSARKRSMAPMASATARGAPRPINRTSNCPPEWTVTMLEASTGRTTLGARCAFALYSLYRIPRGLSVHASREATGWRRTCEQIRQDLCASRGGSGRRLRTRQVGQGCRPDGGPETRSCGGLGIERGARQRERLPAHAGRLGYRVACDECACSEAECSQACRSSGIGRRGPGRQVAGTGN
jgi:hypothetical protein